MLSLLFFRGLLKVLENQTLKETWKGKKRRCELLNQDEAELSESVIEQIYISLHEVVLCWAQHMLDQLLMHLQSPMLMHI